jgi:hypothetical protein
VEFPGDARGELTEGDHENGFESLALASRLSAFDIFGAGMKWPKLAG